MSPASNPKQNQILAALPALDYARLLPDLKPLDMPLGWMVFESGARMEYMYFPTTAIVSQLYVMEDGRSAEIAIIGHEGVVGLPLLFGTDRMPSQALVQSAGAGYRIRASAVKAEIARAGALRHLLMQYAQAQIIQVTQTAVCNRHHTVDQQLCRWLLMSIDRLSCNELRMTQELIANMLGVRREGVTEAAGKLQKAGLIHYSRGKITVLDRAALERHVCECYAAVKTEYDRLLPYPSPAEQLQPANATVPDEARDWGMIFR